MADTQRETRSNETTQRTQQTRAKSDVARTPETQHEVQRPGGSRRGELTRRGNFELGRDPFAMMHALHREMDRLFEDFGFGGSLLRGPRLAGDLERSFGDIAGSGWSPQLEVYERDGKLHVSADLPGLNKDDVRVEVLNNQLTIEGERQSEQRDEKGGWSERSYGRFFRSIPLPDGISADSASASFDNGVLHITLDAPKREEQRGKQIPIGETKSGR